MCQLFSFRKNRSLIRYVKVLIWIIIFCCFGYCIYESLNRYVKYRLCSKVDFINFTLPIVDYYAEYNKYPNEIAHLLKNMYDNSYERDYRLIELIEKLELKIAEREDELLIYDVGFDGVDDHLGKIIMVYPDTKFSEVFFYKGDILVYGSDYSIFEMDNYELKEWVESESSSWSSDKPKIKGN